MSIDKEFNCGRPIWNDYFLSQAMLVATKSPDSQTKCGCIIVDKKTKIILGQGYNGFPRGLQDESLPRTRPDKYRWMIHAEVNAVLNCNTRPEGAVAYITTNPCFECLKLMWQAGIKEVVYATNGSKPYMLEIDEEYQAAVKRFTRMTFMKITGVEANLDHLERIIKYAPSES